jgi:hypothetical protein
MIGNYGKMVLFRCPEFRHTVDFYGFGARKVPGIREKSQLFPLREKSAQTESEVLSSMRPKNSESIGYE